MGGVKFSSAWDRQMILVADGAIPPHSQKLRPEPWRHMVEVVLLIEGEVDELQIAKFVCRMREWVIGALAGNSQNSARAARV